MQPDIDEKLFSSSTMPSSSDTDSLSPAQSVAGDLPTPPPSKQQQPPAERIAGAAVSAALDHVNHSDTDKSAGLARLRIPSPTAAAEKSSAPSASSALAPAVKRQRSSTPINPSAHKKQREVGLPSSSPESESESPVQLRSELREARHEIKLLETQLALANERTRVKGLERIKELGELNNEIADHKETKAKHLSLSRELEGLKKSRTIDINGARAEEQDAAKVTERELRQRIATLEIADGKRRLGDLARKIEMVEDEEKKLELEEAKVKEARRVKELTDDAKARWGWTAGK